MSRVVQNGPKDRKQVLLWEENDKIWEEIWNHKSSLCTHTLRWRASQTFKKMGFTSRRPHQGPGKAQTHRNWTLWMFFFASNLPYTACLRCDWWCNYAKCKASKSKEINQTGSNVVHKHTSFCSSVLQGDRSVWNCTEIKTTTNTFVMWVFTAEFYKEPVPRTNVLYREKRFFRRQNGS